MYSCADFSGISKEKGTPQVAATSTFPSQPFFRKKKFKLGLHQIGAYKAHPDI